MLKTALITMFVAISFAGMAQNGVGAQSEAFEPVSATSHYYGIWMLEDTSEFVNPLCEGGEEFCDMTPGGDKILFSEESNYFTSYIHPDLGASIDLQFTYERNEGLFQCTMVQTNALGYWMEHEYQIFTFELTYSEELDKLMIVCQDGTFHHFIRATEEDLK